VPVSSEKPDLSAIIASLQPTPQEVIQPYVSAIPDAATLFAGTSLYAEIAIDIRDAETIENMKRHNYRFDSYCTACELPSIFAGGVDPYSSQPRSLGLGSASWVMAAGYFSCEAYCLRCHGHYSYYFLLDERSLTKIGQFPSLEDIQAGDLRRFRSVLPKDDLRELKRAGGLFSHGIGIGSFVYLRRIFERLIVNHRIIYESQGGVITGWDRLRIDEKIEALKSVLPPALVKHKAAYGILSRGLHELDEETCRRYFPVVRAAIVQILEQDLQQKETRKAEADLEKQLTAISAEIAQK
jgi:hypothetical protein